MIFCRKLLFIHVPKTGGMSATEYLLRTLPRPIYYTHPDCEEAYEADGVHHIPGLRHESINEARPLLRKYGVEISQIPLILAGIRNPYSLEVSRYAYLRMGHTWDNGVNQELALTADFTTFARESCDHTGGRTKLQDYFLLDEVLPPNVEVVHSENLAAEMVAALRKVSIQALPDFPWVNRSSHEDFLAYYTTEAEEAVYRRYQWIFDQGFYERLDPKMIKPDPNLCWEGRRLPLVGPVHQGSLPTGFWQDLWIGQLLSFDLQPRQRIVGCTIEGYLPPPAGDSTELCLQMDDQITTIRLGGEQRFTWSTPCTFESGTRIRFNLSTSRTWCPSKAGTGRDRRELGFRLYRIRLEPSKRNE